MTPFAITRRTLILAAFLACSSPIQAGRIDFDQEIRPILANHCFKCHGRDSVNRASDFRLDQRDNALHVFAATEKQPSEFWRRVSSHDPEMQMPPPSQNNALTMQQIKTLQQWIAEGAVYSQHWAFRAPIRPAIPSEQLQHGINAIDQFVMKRLSQLGLELSPAAGRNTLIRRVTLDLTGLPPTPQEVSRFVSDQSPDAYERLVDRLLASPRFGERMGQNWLDAARYADTTGHAADVPRTMWLYRNWVIDALNENMPFDQFTIEQLAGDLLPDATQRQLIATGFHRNSMQALGNNPRKEEFRIKGIVDRLDTTGRVWMGLTLACAECHDHKYDPISTQEYYQLFAILNNVPHHGERFDVHGPRLKVLARNTAKRMAALDDEIKQLQLNLESDPTNAQRKREIAEAVQKKQNLKDGAITAQVMDELPQRRKTYVHVRGDFKHRGAEVQPTGPGFLPPISGESVAGTTSRLSLARWLVDGRHPLVARVTANRMWQHFFGRGLVETPDDFGLRSAAASHPELLDWLATEFVDSDWDVKKIHRQIVMSATYRQASQMPQSLSGVDPQNRWLSRGPRFRLPAEQIRDVTLCVSGLLNSAIGGPSVYPVQPDGIGEFRDETAGKWNTSPSAGQYRRGMYTFWQRMSPYPSLAVFDAPSRERTCVLRSRTNTPLQALTLMNDPVYFEMARAFAHRIIRESTATFDGRLTHAFRLALARDPVSDELKRFEDFMRRIGYDVTSEDHHAWTLVAQALLNLDEFVTKE